MPAPTFQLIVELIDEQQQEAIASSTDGLIPKLMNGRVLIDALDGLEPAAARYTKVLLVDDEEVTRTLSGSFCRAAIFSWFGNFLRWRGRLETTRWFLWGTFLAFPTGFVAVLCGWFTAEVGRQPWVVYGLLRTKDAVTPSLTTGDVLFSLACYVLVYAVVYSFGLYYIYKLLHEGPTGDAKAIPGATRQAADGVRRQCRDGDRQRAPDRRMNAMEPSNLALFWAGVIAAAILLYVILDGLDLGVGVLFGTTRDEAHRARMMGTIAPFWDGNETWLVVIGAGLFAAFPDVYAVFLGAFYLPVLLLLLGPDLPRRRVRVPLPERAHALGLGLGLLPRLDAWSRSSRARRSAR